MPWRFLAKIVECKPEERRALFLAFFFNFAVLGSYYVVKPIRDDIGAANGVEKLSWMFTGTMIVMIIANALFAAIVSRMSRRRFIPLAYHFFVFNLALFYFAMRLASPAAQFWVGVAFFTWVSVFNVFVVTVFWAFMTDVFTTNQGKRLFGFISVGGQLGGILGALITGSLVKKVGAGNLLMASAVLLEAAAFFVRIFPADFHSRKTESGDDVQPSTIAKDEQPVGGGIVAGFSHVIRSPYLLLITAFMFLYAITTTFLYFQQADLSAQTFHDRAARTAFFAHIDIWVNSLTALIQIFFTGRLIKWFGIGATLAFLPVLSMIGFISIGWMPVIGLLAAFQVARRAGNFAITRPAREVLFTVLSREDKYKAKSFIDTFIYRLSDQIGAWSYALLHWLGLGLVQISWVAVPLTAIWGVVAVWLGRRQNALSQAKATSAWRQP